MSTKKMGFADRVIFILGLTLAGVVAFVLLAGLIVAVIKIYMSSSKRAAEIMTELDKLRSIPAVETSSENAALLDNTTTDQESNE